MGPHSSQLGLNERRQPRDAFPSSTAVSDSAVTPGISSDSEPDLVTAAKKQLARQMKERTEKKEAEKKKTGTPAGKTTGSTSATTAEREKLKKQLKDQAADKKTPKKVCYIIVIQL